MSREGFEHEKQERRQAKLERRRRKACLRTALDDANPMGQRIAAASAIGLLDMPRPGKAITIGGRTYMIGPHGEYRIVP